MLTHKARARMNVADLEKVLDAGSPVDERDRMNRTPLMYTAVDKQFELMEIFLRHCADPNAQDDAGWTALHFAAQECFVAGIELLVKHGAKLEAKDSHGNTALQRATYSWQEGPNPISTLLKLGADPYSENKHGVTPISLADQSANEEKILFFENAGYTLSGKKLSS